MRLIEGDARAFDVAALYIDANGPYPHRVAECFDEKRDARTYALDLPVIAHPPCNRWCRFAGLVEKRWGHKRGEDGGLFAHALETVRRCGGVLEHPAYSDAWPAFGLPRPITGGAWTQGTAPDEWTCYVEQWRYGHLGRKATWLYYCGARPPFDLKWGYLDPHDAKNEGLGRWRGNTRAQRDGREPLQVGGYQNLRRTADGRLHGSSKPKLTKKQGRVTPPEFLDTLIALARWAVST